jgi:hypothetical protein
MQSKAATVEEYLAELPEERRAAIGAVRETILKCLPKGYEEGMQYGMIGYFVPHSVYPPGYHCNPNEPLPYAGLASQQNYISVYLFCLYCDNQHEKWFREAWAKTGKKLDMGKSCIRFKRLDDMPLALIGQAIKRVPVKKFIQIYESAIAASGRKRNGTPAKKSRVRKGEE